MPEDKIQDALEKLQSQFGSREGFMGFQILMLSQTGQPCDITFWKREPLLEVTIDEQISLAMAYGAGPKKLQEILSGFRVSSGDRVNMVDVWTINPMPKGGFTPEDLAAVDLSQGDEAWGPDGETLRAMIRDTYHCKTPEDEEHFLRRFIAS